MVETHCLAAKIIFVFLSCKLASRFSDVFSQFALLLASSSCMEKVEVATLSCNL